MQDAVVRLQDLIYDSVASPQLWPDVANELGALAGASAAPSLFAKTGTSRQSQLVRRLREASLMPPGG